ncbi:MAG: hypothetical protein AAGC81_03310 [Pseudomonadota bacterium]
MGVAFENAHDAYQHYASIGERAGHDPSPFFYNDWYKWRNPDSKKHKTPLDHFIDLSGSKTLDPAPFIDSVKLVREAADSSTSLDIYSRLVAGEAMGISPNLADHFADLAEARETFLRRIDLRILRDRGKGRRNLVWVQSGRSFKPADWFDSDATRDWDLLCNWYDLSCLDLRIGDIVTRQSGTKFTGIATVLRQTPELLKRYDQVLFVDDDLEFTHADIDRVFGMAEEHRLDLFQPTLSAGSHCVWPDLFQRPGSDFRIMSGVEIMMFGFSARALELCEPCLATAVSGFGLDLSCSETVRNEGWLCGAIDAVAVDHKEAIDEGGGSYYEFMRRIGINQQLELFEAIEKFGRKPNFVELSA